jgi:hypothetical protein
MHGVWVASMITASDVRGADYLEDTKIVTDVVRAEALCHIGIQIDFDHYSPPLENDLTVFHSINWARVALDMGRGGEPKVHALKELSAEWSSARTIQ